MFKSLSNAFKIPELRKRILFTLGMLIVFRMGIFIPTPGVNVTNLQALFGQGDSPLIDFFNLFSGGALTRFSIFALGIAPYINSSIIMQLLVYVIPYLQHLAKESGEEGRKKINQYTRYGTIIIAILQAFGITFMLERYNVVHNPGWGFKLMAVTTLTAGTAFVMWLGEKMTEKGIGNGVSMIITTGIVAGFLPGLIQHMKILRGDLSAPIVIKNLVLLALMIMTVMLVVWVQEAVRKIPVQYAKRVVGRRVYGGQNTFIPLKVNQAGVIPVIFASSILMFPTMIFKWISGMDYAWVNGKAARWFLTLFEYNSPSYYITYSILIFLFTFFYTAITFDVRELADNLKKYGGFIPGIRAGQKTVDFLEKTLTKVTTAGAIFLIVISLIPNFLMTAFGLNFYFGGTALLIVVGVILETFNQLESHLVTRHYEGFMKKKKA